MKYEGVQSLSSFRRNYEGDRQPDQSILVMFERDDKFEG